MKTFFKKFFRNIVLVFFCALGHLTAQNQELKGAIHAIARATPDSVILRWAPSNKETWRLCNQHGYIIERITITQNKIVLKKPIRLKLNSAPITPWPLNNWEAISNNNTYGSIAAQALYGADFKVDPKKENRPLWQQAYQKSNEQDMRYSFALFAADLDVPTSKASGLRWVDKTVKKGEKYLYKIYVAAFQKVIKIDTALVYTGSETLTPLPKPAEFRADFLDSTAVLSWNAKVQKSVYVAYFIERSIDKGLTFQSMNKEPFVPILNENKNPFSFYKDSTLPSVELQYRICGLNAFGEKGPYTDVVKGMSKPAPRQAPQYLKYDWVDTNKVRLLWQFETDQMATIKGFKIYRSEEYNSGYKVISGSTLLLKTQRFFVDPTPSSAAYYQAVAIDLNGKEHTSFPILVQVQDNQAPSAPKDLKGKIDKQGKVLLSWSKNTEKDLLGYYVYTSNGRLEESSRLSSAYLSLPTFTDQIDLQTLTDSIYYEVLALDKHYNESSRTLLALPRPDIIPPAAIAMISAEGSEKGIVLVWHNSSSKDIKEYLISRKVDGMDMDENFHRIIHQGDTSKFVDSTALLGTVYQYYVQAIDKGGLRSEKMPSLKVQRKKISPRAMVQLFTGGWDPTHKKIMLQWKASGSPVRHWIIYRASQGETLARYESTVGESFIDAKVEMVKTYEYYLRPVFEDKTLGNLSQMLTIKKEE